MSLDDAQHYFEFLANLGLTKHIGSMEATRQLVDLCHIGSGDHVLDVGTGVGATPPYLVRALDCRVVAVDLLESMVRQSRERARARGVEARVAFAAADARSLPFADDLFDVVIMESLNAFFEDKVDAMREYARVTRPGGCVGMTEMTWLSPPSPETAAYYKRTVYADALQAERWIELLEEAGLQDVTGHAQPVDLPSEGKGRIERYGCRGFLGVLLRTVRTVFKDRASRAFLKDVTQSIPRDIMGDMGYGVYAGRKPS
jgi:SAM-dependent methyltransferase